MTLSVPYNTYSAVILTSQYKIGIIANHMVVLASILYNENQSRVHLACFPPLFVVKLQQLVPQCRQILFTHSQSHTRFAVTQEQSDFLLHKL